MYSSYRCFFIVSMIVSQFAIVGGNYIIHVFCFFKICTLVEHYGLEMPNMVKPRSVMPYLKTTTQNEDLSSRPEK